MDNNKKPLEDRAIDSEELIENQEDTEISDKNETDENKKKKTKKAVIVSFSILGFFLTIILAVVGIFFHYVSKINIQRTKAEVYDSIEIDDLVVGPDSPLADINALEGKMKANFDKDGLMQSDDVLNILVLGTDSRQNNERGRSDCMILVSLNKATDEIIMTSLLRDMYVTIPGKENSKLTHAYSYGGADLAVDAVEQNFKIDIDNYVQINFFSFMEVVDAVGGLDINIAEEELRSVNGYINQLNELLNLPNGTDCLKSAGKQHLNGKQALGYTRVRYVGTDFARTSRQRYVFEEVIKKASKLSVGELDNFVDELFPMITTDLTETDIFSLLVKAPTYFSYDVVQHTIPTEGTWEYMTIRSMSVLGVDFEANQEYLFKNIYRYEEE